MTIEPAPRLRGLKAAALLFLFSASGCGGSQKPAPLMPPARPRFVNLELPLLGGGRFVLGRLRGSPVVITLFATWSLRSQAEAPRFVRLHEQEGPRGLKVIGIALDKGAQSLIETYVDFVGFRFDVALALPNDLALVAALGRTTHVPRTVLLDRRGVIVQDHPRGQTDFSKLARGIERLLPRAKRRIPATRPAGSQPVAR